MKNKPSFTKASTFQSKLLAPLFWILDQIDTRLAKESDWTAIARIQQASPEAAQWPVGDYSNYIVIVALARSQGANDPVVGFCAFRQTVPGEAELLNLAVGPGYRRAGIGSALLEDFGRRATGDMFLEVAENNEPALNLYRSHGWLPVSKRPGYYSQNNINAVVMKKSSC